MDQCVLCNMPLTDQNWPIYRRKKSNRRCTPCVNAYSREYAARNTEKTREYQRRHRLKNPLIPKPKVSRKHTICYTDPNAAAKQRKQETSAAYYAKNRERFYESNAKRRAALRDQVATNADFMAIRDKYSMAERLTRIIGVPYHVDHIKPISKGGLHHQDNLVVMRGDINLRKKAQDWTWLVWFNEPLQQQ